MTADRTRQRARRAQHVIGALALVTAVTVVGGCSDGDGGSAGNAGADAQAAFCERMAAFAAASDDAGAGELTPEVLAEMRELAEAAPEGEVRDALEAVLPVITEIDGLDENDPQAFERIMELIFSPELTEAAEVLERTWTEDCGGGG